MSSDDLEKLRELPVHAAPAVERQARAAFVRAFEETTWLERALATGGRASVPLVLASVVGLYLFWALSTASSLVQ